MAYNAKAIANEFLELAKRSGKTLTPMQVHKLVYIAHGWNLALLKSPLIDSTIEAWRYGPVVPTLWHEMKIYGGKAVKNLLTHWEPVIKHDERRVTIQTTTPRVPESDTNTRALLERVWEVYGNLSAWQLSELTHRDGTPWKRTVEAYGENIPKGLDIPDEVIQQHFSELRDS